MNLKGPVLEFLENRRTWENLTPPLAWDTWVLMVWGNFKLSLAWGEYPSSGRSSHFLPVKMFWVNIQKAGTKAFFRTPRRGALAKGGFCRMQCRAQENTKHPRALDPAVHLVLRSPHPRKASSMSFLQEPPLQIPLLRCIFSFVKEFLQYPEGPARQIDVSRQKLSPHCLEAIFDSQFPSPKLSPKMPLKLSLPHKRGLFILFQN